MDAAVREKNVTLLAGGTQALLDSLAGISEELAKTRPAPDRWSVLECVEHVILAENGLFTLLTMNSAPAASPADGSREETFVRNLTNRNRKIEAPEFARPTGRFPTLTSAVEEFCRSRARVAGYLEQCEDDLRSRTAMHPIAGMVSGQELVVILAFHPARHAMQIREIRQTLSPA